MSFLKDDLVVSDALASQTLTNGTVNGTSVDLSAGDFGHQQALFVVTVGAWTDGSHVFTIEEADDNAGSPGTFATADAAVADTFTVSDGTNDSQKHYVGYTGLKEWVRVTAVTSGATTGLAGVEAIAIAGRASKQPVR